MPFTADHASVPRAMPRDRVSVNRATWQVLDCTGLSLLTDESIVPLGRRCPRLRILVRGGEERSLLGVEGTLACGTCCHLGTHLLC